jgi:tetratricopeptide (TPR) repeat protein
MPFSPFLKVLKIFLTAMLTIALSCASTRNSAKPDNSGSTAPQAEQVKPAEAGALSPADNAPGVSLMDAVEQSADKIAGELPKGSRVAIVAFESESGNLSDFIMEEITGALIDRGIEVADRQNLDYLQREFEFQMSGNVDEEKTKSVGKFLAADMVITGQLLNVGATCRYRTSAIRLEQATRAVVTRQNVRNDAEMRGMAAALANQRTTVKTAKYGSDQKAPQTAGTFLDRGILLASRGEYKLAVEDFTEVLRLNPNISTAYALRARARIGEAAFHVAATDVNFGYIAVNFSRGGKLTKEQSRICDSVIADLNQAIRLDPQNSSHYRERGRAYSFKENYDKAMADYNQAIRLNPNDAKAYNSRGHGALDRNDCDKAIADFNQAIKLDPNYAHAYLNRGSAYYKKGNAEMAIADYNQAIKLDPNGAEAYIYRSLVYYEKGNGELAVADGNHAVRLEPNFTYGYIARGAAHNGNGNYDMAITDANQAMRLDSSEISAYGIRAEAYSKKGDYERALADYNRAIRLNPDIADAYLDRGNVYANKGDYERAMADYNQAIRLKPNLAEAYLGRGNVYDNKGDHERALADFNQAIRLKPNFAGAYNSRGVFYANKGYYERALADYNQAIGLTGPTDKNLADGYVNRGNAYNNTGNYERALADYDRAIRLNPNFGLAYFCRGGTYLNKNDYDKAIADYNQAIRLNPNHPYNRLAKQNLEKARQRRGR